MAVRAPSEQRVTRYTLPVISPPIPRHNRQINCPKPINEYIPLTDFIQCEIFCWHYFFRNPTLQRQSLSCCNASLILLSFNENISNLIRFDLFVKIWVILCEQSFTGTYLYFLSLRLLIVKHKHHQWDEIHWCRQELWRNRWALGHKITEALRFSLHLPSQKFTRNH